MQSTFTVTCEYQASGGRQAFSAQCIGWPVTDEPVSLPGDMASWIPHPRNAPVTATWRGIIIPTDEVPDADVMPERLVLRITKDDLFWADIDAVAREPNGAQRVAFVIVGRGKLPTPLLPLASPTTPTRSDLAPSPDSEADSRIVEAIAVVDDLLTTDHSKLEEGFLFDLRDDLELLRDHLTHRDATAGRSLTARLRRLASQLGSVPGATVEVIKLASHLETAADIAAAAFGG